MNSEEFKSAYRMKELSFSEYFRKSFQLLKSTNIDYLIIGGVAVGVWGEPRLTEDIDVIVFISKKDVRKILLKANKNGFIFNEKVILENVKNTGVFKIFYREYHLDFLIASTELEQSALKRKIKVQIFGEHVFVPSKEDLLLFKIIPGREKDLLDAKGVAIRYKGKLDRVYLKKWAEILSDEAEDMRIYNHIIRLLDG